MNKKILLLAILLMGSLLGACSFQAKVDPIPDEASENVLDKFSEESKLEEVVQEELIQEEVIEKELPLSYDEKDTLIPFTQEDLDKVVVRKLGGINYYELNTLNGFYQKFKNKLTPSLWEELKNSTICFQPGMGVGDKDTLHKNCSYYSISVPRLALSFLGFSLDWKGSNFRLEKEGFVADISVRNNHSYSFALRAHALQPWESFESQVKKTYQDKQYDSSIKGFFPVSCIYNTNSFGRLGNFTSDMNYIYYVEDEEGKTIPVRETYRKPLIPYTGEVFQWYPNFGKNLNDLLAKDPEAVSILTLWKIEEDTCVMSTYQSAVKLYFLYFKERPEVYYVIESTDEFQFDGITGPFKIIDINNSDGSSSFSLEE